MIGTGTHRDSSGQGAKVVVDAVIFLQVEEFRRDQHAAICVYGPILTSSCVEKFRGIFILNTEKVRFQCCIKRFLVHVVFSFVFGILRSSFYFELLFISRQCVLQLILHFNRHGLFLIDQCLDFFSQRLDFCFHFKTF